ncbi:MAG: glycerophosphodiester phosphodiesterase [Candidatus Dormiibacterota bacterium]
MAHRRENTLEAFSYAQSLGIGGVETDAWLTVDGVPVLHHDGRIRVPAGRRLISQLRKAELPDHVPSLADLYERCGTGLELAIDVLDPAAAAAIVATANEAGRSAIGRLWLCSPDVGRLEEWRRLDGDLHLVHSDGAWRRLHRGDAASHVRRLRGLGVEVLNLRSRDCLPPVLDACHNNGLGLFAWGVARLSTMRRLIRIGVDGMMSDHVDRMLVALRDSRGA